MPKFSVKKPLTVLVVVIIVLVLGVVSYMNMTPDLLPNIDLPYVVVMTTYPGATPEKVETTVTKPLEQVMATLENIVSVSSTSSENYSTIILEFTEDVNMDTITVDILQKINTISGYWDDMVGTPMILKLNPNMLPVMVAAVDVEGLDTIALSEFMNNELMGKLEGVTGIASISATGLIEEQIKVTIDPKKLAAINRDIRKELDQTFAEAETELNNALQEIDEGQEKLDEGNAELDDAQNQLAEQMAQGEMQLTAQQRELLNTKKDLETQLAELKKQLVSLEENEVKLIELKDTVTQLEEAQTAIPEAIKQLDELQRVVNDLSAAEQQLSGQIEQINQNPYLTDEQKQQIIAQITASGASEQISAAYAEIDAALNAFGTTRNTIKRKQMELEDNLEEVNTGLETIDASLADMGLTRADLDSSITELADGKEQLKNGITELENAIVQLEDGSLQLEDAIKQLSEQKSQAVFELNSAKTELLIGSNELANAKKQAEDGLQQLKDSRESAYEKANVEEILTVEMVSNILMAQNFAMPAGYVSADDVQYLVTVGDAFASEEELAALMLFDLGMEGVDPIYLDDIATIERVDNADTVYAKVNHNDGILLSFSKQSTYSTAEASDNLRAKFKELSAQYDGLTFTPMMDQGDYIYIVVDSIMENLLLGALFAIVILFFFLKDIKPTFTVLCSIPISVIFAIVLMYFSGVTLNIISLSGLAVAVGMLVDNSVVVIENIYRLRAKGVSAIKASVSGAVQVSAAIFASTLTTICVFVPIVFVEGITRQLFTDMALTIGYSLLASLIVALTLVPAMSSRMLRNFKEKKSPWFGKILHAYEKTAVWSLKHKVIVLGAALVLLAASFVLVLQKGFSFMPAMDSPQLTITVAAPEESGITDVRDVADTAMERIMTIDGVDSVSAMAGGGSMMGLGGSGGTDFASVTMYVILDADTERTGSEVAAEIDALCGDLAVPINASGASSMTDAMAMLGGSGVTVNVYGNDLDTLASTATEIAELLATVEGVAQADNGIEETEPEIRFVVDKEKAMMKGLTTAQVYQAVSEALQTETTATNLSASGDSIDVVVYDGGAKELTPDYIKKLTITATKQDGTTEEVKLSDICEILDTETMTSIQRMDQRRYLSVTATVADGYNVTLVTEAAEKALASYDLPDGITIAFTGENETIMSAIKDLLLMLLLGVLFVYLIMVAQFQSLKSPFIVMFTIPLAFTGGLLGLLLTGLDLSVISMIGFVMLTGIIVNNGIVLVDYINQLRLEGVEKRQAIVEAGVTRMRPILMTTITTVLGLSVMAVGTGTGSELMQPVAIVCIGGLIYATLMTLYVVPVMYDILNKKELRKISEEDLNVVEEDSVREVIS